MIGSVRRACTRLFGHRSYTRFVIVARSRTGSNLLASMLNTHPEIVCWDEIFGRLGRRQPVKALRSTFRGHGRAIRAVGFKLFYYHPLDHGRESLWDHLEGDEDLHVLHLRRKNVLRTLVSFALARQTSEWMKRGGAESTPRRKSVTLTPEWLEERFVRTRRWEQEADERFAKHPLLHLTYERMAADPLGTIQGVYDHIGVRPYTPEVRLRRQNPEPLSDLVDNFTELRDAFAGSEWERYFRSSAEAADRP